jgi:hypothetical protein
VIEEEQRRMRNKRRGKEHGKERKIRTGRTTGES